MSKNTKYLILGGVLIGMVVLLFFFGSQKRTETKKSAEKNTKNRVKIDSASYKRPVNSNGSYLLYNLLTHYEKCNAIEKIQTTYQKNLERILPKKSKNSFPNTYLTITENFELNYEDNEWLKEFVADGNIVFIAADNISYEIKDLFTEQYYGFSNYYDTTVVLNFYHSEFKTDENLELKNGALNSHGFPKYKLWSYFESEDLLDNVVKIEYVGSPEFPVCMMVKYGKGRFILHTEPSTFSNINLLKKEG